MKDTHKNAPPTIDMLPSPELTPAVLDALGLQKQIAYIQSDKVSKDKKAAQNLERQKKHQAKLKDAGLVSSWVPSEIAEAIKAGKKVIIADDDLQTKKEPEAVSLELPEYVKNFSQANGWEKVADAIKLKKKVSELPRWKRWLLGF